MKLLSSSSSSLLSKLTLLVVLVCLDLAAAAKGSCRLARKCCDGKDADCVVQVKIRLG